jgi:hypothetical protein
MSRLRRARVPEEPHDWNRQRMWWLDPLAEGARAAAVGRGALATPEMLRRCDDPRNPPRHSHTVGAQDCGSGWSPQGAANYDLRQTAQYRRRATGHGPRATGRETTSARREAMTVDGRAKAMAGYGFADVLAIEEMLDDLRARGDPGWRARIARWLRSWTDGLFDGLT